MSAEDFISSKKASELFGYAPDHIGRLCRLGKVEAKRVGKDWFVSREGLFKYQSKNGNIFKTQLEENLPAKEPVKIIEEPVKVILVETNNAWDKELFKNIEEVKNIESIEPPKNYFTFNFKIAAQPIKIFLALSAFALFFFTSTSSSPNI